MTLRFSANLGFLWQGEALPDAIRAARKAGFDAVECHWPFDTPASAVTDALAETGLPMVSLNTRRGDGPGETGLAALPGREACARRAIDEALAYAQAVGAGAVHVMAGRAEGPAARDTFLRNLDHACRTAPDLTVLIEPLNRHDAPGYFLRSTDQAAALLHELGQPNAKLMFDCYHVGRSEGDVATRLTALVAMIGHIQFAAVPDRGPPDRGELCYRAVFSHLAALGWSRPLGAEYRPDGRTEDSLAWLSAARSDWLSADA